MYNFANKLVEWRAKNGFVGDNSRTSTDRPYVNVNQRNKESLCESVNWTSKTAKMTIGVY